MCIYVIPGQVHLSLLDGEREGNKRPHTPQMMQSAAAFCLLATMENDRNRSHTRTQFASNERLSANSH